MLSTRLIGDHDPVVLLQEWHDAPHHDKGLLLVGLLHLDHLEAARQGRILLEVLLVLGPGRCRYRPQLATGKGGLEEVGRISGSGRAAGADQRMGLVDEEDDGRRRTPSPR